MFLPARLRTEAGWRDATIANVSSRGLMLRCVSPPRQRAFVEVRHRGVVIVGQVMWSHGNRAGLRARDVINLAELLAQGSLKPHRAGEERRVAPRAEQPRPRAAGAREANFARVFDWVIVAAGGVAGAVAVFEAVRTALEGPLLQVGAAMSGG